MIRGLAISGHIFDQDCSCVNGNMQNGTCCGILMSLEVAPKQARNSPAHKNIEKETNLGMGRRICVIE